MSSAYENQVVKFRAPDEHSLNIFREDVTIASLKTLMISLNEQIVSLDARVVGLTERARNAVAQNNRTFALASLRSKKLNESVLNRRVETLAQLEGVYRNIEQASDQIEIVRVMEASTKVLHRLHAEVGGIERVEEIMQELKDEMAKVNEIGSAVNELGLGSEIIDDDAVDEELETLEKQNRQAEEDEALRTMEKQLRSLDAAKSFNGDQKDLDNVVRTESRASKTSLEETTTSLADREARHLEQMTLDEQNDPPRRPDIAQRNTATHTATPVLNS